MGRKTASVVAMVSEVGLMLSVWQGLIHRPDCLILWPFLADVIARRRRGEAVPSLPVMAAA